MGAKKKIWTDELSIGNVRIDNDHKKLLEVYDDLVDLIEHNGSNEDFAKILSKMTDYVFKHLKNEEKYMEEFGYPKLKEHQQFHRNYNYKVSMYNFNLLGSNPPNPHEIIEYIREWWINHILKHDIDYENYRNSIGSDVSYDSF
ncbi:MAG TPA: hemerythrin family protein [Prolixibacteraceae bacterium]|nr:hemerythrin family protein [Prolixibacteraceae bacterium]